MTLAPEPACSRPPIIHATAARTSPPRTPRVNRPRVFQRPRNPPIGRPGSESRNRRCARSVSRRADAKADASARASSTPISPRRWGSRMAKTAALTSVASRNGSPPPCGEGVGAILRRRTNKHPPSPTLPHKGGGSRISLPRGGSSRSQPGESSHSQREGSSKSERLIIAIAPHPDRSAIRPPIGSGAGPLPAKRGKVTWRTRKRGTTEASPQSAA